MQKAGLAFDLPTDDQWEYACRAGTTTDFNNGTNLTSDDMDPNMQILGSYEYNAGYDEVGRYLPNAWGLYDMHGGAPEWAKFHKEGFYTGAWESDGHSCSNEVTTVDSGAALRGCGWYDYGYNYGYDYGYKYHEYRNYNYVDCQAVNCCSWAVEMVEGTQEYFYKTWVDGTEEEPYFYEDRRGEARGGIRLIRP